MSKRGFGVVGALEPTVIRQLAQAAEARGYHSFWVNDTPSGDGLGALAAAAQVTHSITLAVGVIPVDRQPAGEIARRIGELALPRDRLTVGIGSGGTRKGGLSLVRAAARHLRAEVGVPVIIGALGPRMCRLGGEVADGVLLNWLTPEMAEKSGFLTREAAASLSRSAPRVAGYIRTAIGLDAVPRLQAEASRYERIPQYARHFQAMGVSGVGTSVTGLDRDGIQAGLRRFENALDEVIVRAITAEDTSELYLSLVEAAAPSAT